jgi:hypothetical protein
MATIPSIAMIPSGYKASKVYSVLPTDGAGDLTFSRAGALPSFNATRVNSEGLIEEVLSNVPRFDYSDGVCPSLLIEPESRNLITYSEVLSNAVWIKEGVSVTDNIAISPSGVLNASKVFANSTVSSSGRRLRSQTIAITNGLSYTVSFFIKKAEYNFVHVRYFYGGGDIGLCLNMTTFAITQGFIDGNFPTSFPPSYSVVNYGNEWVRVIATFTAPSTTNFICYLYPSTSSTTTLHTPTLNDGFLFSKAQLEALPYASSYIPTVASTVTRVAETVSKTGISDLIGQTEGTVFLNTKYSASATASGRWFNVFDTTNNIGLALNGVNSVRTIINGASDTITTSPKTNLGVKIAFAYNSLGVVLFINGVQYALPNGGSQIITSLNSIVFDPLANPQLQTVDVNLLALWKERLSNETLTQLTTL